MDQNIQRALWLGVGIMMFAAIITTGLFIFNKGKSLADQSGEQLDATAEQLAAVETQKFDYEEVSGSDVLNLIQNKKHDTGEFIVLVTTSYPSSHQYVSSGTISDEVLSEALTEKDKDDLNDEFRDMKDESSEDYINPHGTFMTQLIYDKNDVVKGVIATQQ